MSNSSWSSFLSSPETDESTAPGWMQRIRQRLLPQSLAARTTLLLIGGLGIIQIIGLTIHAMDRFDFDQRMIYERARSKMFTYYRAIVETAPSDRDRELAALHLPENITITLTPGPEPDMINARALPGRPPFAAHMHQPHEWNGPRADDMAPVPFGPGGPDGGGDGPGRHNGGGPFSPDSPGGPHGFGPENDQGMGPLPPSMRPEQVLVSPATGRRRAVAFLLPDERRWVTIHYVLPRPSPFRSPTFPIAFLIMTFTGGLLILWGVRRLIAPVSTLAAAAEELGRNMNAPPMPENGPREVARAAHAFNTMAHRIRRYLTDRTLMLTAIGHDLRTPITRLKLRAEFIEDDEMRIKMLSDLDELEAMVAATLAFGRDASQREPMGQVNLTAMLQTITDEAAETYLDAADQIVFVSENMPDVLVRARPMALKRALSNLVTNAVKYGGGARITLLHPHKGNGEDADEYKVTILIEDEGPGLPTEDLERMFDPFVRAEQSRNRETGGTGLGLSISRNIIWGLGGDIRLGNRQPHGLRVTVTLVC
ncbi:ATP-binding protein [Komagataeibacter oboediens]|uniref:histidine kinase n=1 Tax=Komagataeibacter oboediens TaxID=65958 RepID=A0A318QRS5_9PROT|nr:ATP-binding protein [Komagataeibacter oboediens]MBL7234469.1 HAMP domain-containing protein [Komagataeibacter oboediens]MBT0676323.1 HAMP domain-containing protein [Komagataeibacter oboediens]MBT0679575.1 HAMP domain-containing protein [Komagataeibacter oboediens]PYD82537.1 two-component sensor histidine kinase [Komagataeibacter oboediens]